MEIVVLGVPGFRSALMSRWINAVEYDLVVRDRLLAIGSQHRVSVFPRPDELDWIIDELILEPAFYEECRKRITDGSRYRAKDEAAVMAALTAEAAPVIARELAHEIRDIPEGESFSASLLAAFTCWRSLEAVIASAYPEAALLLGESFQDPIGLRFSELIAQANRLWELGRLLHPLDYLESVAAIEPRVVVLHGRFPEDLPGAIMMATKLRPSLPDATLLLYPSTADLFTSFAHTKRSLLDSDALFELIDCVPVYTDLRDLTLCEVVERVASGKSSLAGIENLVCRTGGRTVITEPSGKTIDRYLDEVAFDQPLRALMGTPLERGTEVTTRTVGRSLATINPVKQLCYWNRCRFCGSSTQRAIRNDPHRDRRASEVAELVTRLDRRGVDLTFLGFEVVPETLLRDLTASFSRAAPTPKWSYEGRFETFYTDEFVDSLADSGCCGIIFGLESPSDRLNRLALKSDGRTTVAEIEKIIGRLDRAGIGVHLNTIVDLPGSTSTDFLRHQRWLERMFDHHAYFHFNTNTFAVLPGSAFAENPTGYGIEIQAHPEADFFLREIPHRRLDVSPTFDRSAIWRRVFGASWFRGCEIEFLHSVYHEASCCAFLDASQGRNLFKQMQADLRPLRDIGALRIELTPGVETICAKDPNVPYMWIADIRGSAGWARIGRPLWELLEQGMECGLTVARSFDDRRPRIDDVTREEAYRAIRELASMGLLTERMGG